MYSITSHDANVSFDFIFISVAMSKWLAVTEPRNKHTETVNRYRMTRNPIRHSDDLVQRSLFFFVTKSRWSCEFIDLILNDVDRWEKHLWNGQRIDGISSFVFIFIYSNGKHIIVEQLWILMYYYIFKLIWPTTTAIISNWNMQFWMPRYLFCPKWMKRRSHSFINEQYKINSVDRDYERAFFSM